MGHIRLGTLPQSKKWCEVVSLLDADAPVERVAEAAVHASERDLSRASDDPGFQFISGHQGAVSGQAPARKLTIVINRNRETVTVDGVVILAKGATAGLILVLSNAFLEAVGQGLDPFDFPAIWVA